jgi:hypothetical protein
MDLALVFCDIGCPVIEASSFYGTQQSRFLPSPEDGNRSRIRNVVFLVISNPSMDKVRKPSICVCNLHVLNKVRSDVSNSVLNFNVGLFFILSLLLATFIIYVPHYNNTFENEYSLN